MAQLFINVSIVVEPVLEGSLHLVSIVPRSEQFLKVDEERSQIDVLRRILIIEIIKTTNSDVP